VLARLAAEEREFKDTGAAAKHLAPLAQKLLCAAAPGDHNQAMMELGALVCHRQNPRCLLCPVARFCAGAAAGNAARLPRFSPRLVEKLAVNRLWLIHDGKLLLRRHASGARRLRDLHELPLAEPLVLKPLPETILAKKRRAISNQQIEETIHRAELTPALEARIRADGTLLWAPLSALSSLTLSGPHRKWISALLK
jgi:A/G-specific adenine glycosylase